MRFILLIINLIFASSASPIDTALKKVEELLKKKKNEENPLPSVDEDSESTTTLPPCAPQPTSTTAPPLMPPLANSECQCNYSSIWLDVMILFEATPGVTNNGLQDMLAHVQSVFDLLTIGTTDSTLEMSTRVGIVTYTSFSKLIARLGTVDIIDNVVLPFHDVQDVTNPDLTGAMRYALAEFESVGHRRNARKVIIIMASTYNPYGDPMPFQLSQFFQQQGGIVITYDYIQVHGLPVPDLADLASPGYDLNSTMDALEMNNKLCEANCFCASDLNLPSDQPREYPGCLKSSELVKHFQGAIEDCASEGGVMFAASNYSNAEIILNMTSSTTAWAGVYSNQPPAYSFVTGSALSSYQPWHSDPNQNCVVQRPDLFWDDLPCDSPAHFVCQLPICSSVHYCDI